MGKLRKRMSFSRINEGLEMPDLIEVQKRSYQRFLETDLKEVLARLAHHQLQRQSGIDLHGLFSG